MRSTQQAKSQAAVMVTCTPYQALHVLATMQVAVCCASVAPECETMRRTSCEPKAAEDTLRGRPWLAPPWLARGAGATVCKLSSLASSLPYTLGVDGSTCLGAFQLHTHCLGEHL